MNNWLVKILYRSQICPERRKIPFDQAKRLGHFADQASLILRIFAFVIHQQLQQQQVCRTKRSRPRSKLASESNCSSRSLLSSVVAFPPPPARTISISTQTDPCSTSNDNYSDNEAEEENAYQVLDWPAEQQDNHYDNNNNTSSQATSSSDLAKIVSSNSSTVVSARKAHDSRVAPVKMKTMHPNYWHNNDDNNDDNDDDDDDDDDDNDDDNKPCNGNDDEVNNELCQYGIEYEEVTLKRHSAKQKLGLTLCYGSVDDTQTDIFISEVQNASLAHLDGRFRTGDQILQINGVDVHSRSQAIELFSQDCPSVTLLLARRRNVFSSDCSDHHHHHHQATDSDPDILPATLSSPSKYSELSTGSGSLSSESSSLKQRCEDDGSAVQVEVDEGLIADSRQVEEEASSGKGSKKASTGVGSTTSLERELQYLHQEMEHIQLECDRLIEQHAKAERKMHKQLQDASRLAASIEHLQNQPKLLQQRPVHAPLLLPSGSSSASVGHGNAVSVRRSPIVTSATTSTNANNIIGSKPKTSITRFPKIAQLTAENLRRSIRFRRDDPPCSVYNNANVDVCRGTAASKPTHCMLIRKVPAEEDGKRDSAFFTLPHNEQQYHNSAANSRDDGGKFALKSTSPDEHIYASISGDTVYTNLENLNSTIAQQQKHFHKAVVEQARQLKLQQRQQRQFYSAGQVYKNLITGEPSCRIPACQQNLHRTTKESTTNTEWKVKRRADGSRYITKKPVRKQILKERAERLANERFGCSTDDDTMSELKVGRYWSKDERRRHLEKGKERKRRQEELLRRKAEQKPANEQQIVQLSYKKMLRRQGQQLLDRFTTVQEFLAHGNRTAENYRALGLLSVTTV
ncbi:PDZ domain-containing RING finger protein 4 [Trichinella pseudospiralis]|uniref:PDZ domain-containing RING finger protein 4 n=1 Tax=Trichinella pseudospiralis TaxID=6337 RepID=A0A0V1E592_TRIPS|nr:PDZ domain-containing RING finger protein 4 [Trichinella pseudospiralis]